MATLKLEDVNMVGICGMGGLGKTTMAKRIMNRALDENVFKEVVIAVVSQPVNELKIQVEIGGSLGLKLEGETSQTRAQKLHKRLSDDTERILVVLDDVWERLVLESLGIPRNHKKCTILLTSRNSDVLGRMNVEKVFGIEVLSEEDAWFLFEQTVGECVDDKRLSSIAKEVVNECKGLPLALETVGSALKGKMVGNGLKMKVSIWKDALRQLRKCDLKIPGFLTDIYIPLKLSYDFLDSMEKFVFLLCCLYPEDAHISLEHLTYFSMGLDKFEGGIENVEDARNSIYTSASILKSRSLLLDSKRGDGYVRMHDVVRDVCIFVAKQERYIGDNHCSWISSFQRAGIPSMLGFPNLRLVLWSSYSANEEFKVESSFLEDIRDLYVLYIERDSFTSLPYTAQSLKTLKSLVINSCEKLKTISIVGELVSLEILICYGCDLIQELPWEMTGLNRLKVLDITRCRNLKRISRGIISSLVGLEEMKMLGSFEKWEADDREERENAGLRELEALTRLRCLEIEIEDPALLAENMRFSLELDKFDIRLKDVSSMFDCDRYDKKLRLRRDKESRLGDWIEIRLLRDTECLVFEGSGAHNVDLAKAENIKVLELGKCESMKKMVKTSMDDGDACVLSSIEYLKLYVLPKLEEIRDGPIWWLNLKELQLYTLPSLKQLWKSSSVHLEKDYLPQLDVLRIERCEEMEQVFKWDGNENNSCHHHITKMLFPKLKRVELERLSNLTSFYHGIQCIEFPQLSMMHIKGCRKLNWVFS